MFRKMHFAWALGLAVCAAQQPLSAQSFDASAEPTWAFEESDLPLDPDFLFGTLDNGMRYVVRHNATPPGQGLVRLHIDAGSLSESDTELGYAHYIEHMAFNGSTNVPEGEMVKLLEREGLAFGADTNASTNFDVTLYMLDLPRNDPGLLDTALMLLRETASELTFAPEAVERERGVVLAEKRTRDTYALQNVVDSLEFHYPGSQLAARFPIGENETLNAASSDSLKALWDKLYTPGNATLIVVGDFDPEEVQAMIERRFADWAPEPRHEQPSAGPIDPGHRGLTDIFIHPALPESVTVSRNGAWLDEPDTVAQRQQDVLRQIGYGIVNRRFQRISRQQDAPFRSAQLTTGGVFRAGRTTSLTVVTGNGEWDAGLSAAAAEYRRSVELGFSEAEVAEQVANLRTAIENSVASAQTRSNGALLQGALALVQDDRIPTTPQSGLDRLNAMIDSITPGNVLAALLDELVPLDDPLIRFTGPTAPDGGEAALRAAWDEAMAAALVDTEETAAIPFFYTDFGPAGTVVSDNVEPLLGIRRIRFDNGLMLNLKQTDLQDDRVLVRLNVDGGNLLNTRDNPLATQLVSGLPIGGLGKHSQDELQSILAGRSVALAIRSNEETFASTSSTTPRDLELQLQLLAALLTDPGYRTEGEIQFRRNIADFFSRKDATPSLTLGNAREGILSDRDPRFSLLDQEAYLALDFAKLRQDISDRLANGALELALVGDFDPDLAIAIAARTLGALPQREAEFRPYTENRDRSFTGDRTRRVLYHEGEATQALLELAWPTRDDSDPVENVKLGLLERVVRLELRDRLREELGKTYSPGVNASQSHTYPGYGTFIVSAEIDVADVAAARQAMLDTVAGLVSNPIDEDRLLRARQPLIERLENLLKTNGGWMNLVDRAQAEHEQIERFVNAKAIVERITPDEIMAVARSYLDPGQGLEILVLPREAAQAGDE
ncbi:MAG TPA: insulinase family protein [Sphingomonadaceae bacterium]|nr:insulinase family protein [Sphingomonadaceae bacterium]